MFFADTEVASEGSTTIFAIVTAVVTFVAAALTKIYLLIRRTDYEKEVIDANIKEVQEAKKSTSLIIRRYEKLNRRYFELCEYLTGKLEIMEARYDVLAERSARCEAEKYAMTEEMLRQQRLIEKQESDISTLKKMLGLNPDGDDDGNS